MPKKAFDETSVHGEKILSEHKTDDASLAGPLAK